MARKVCCEVLLMFLRRWPIRSLPKLVYAGFETKRRGQLSVDILLVDDSKTMRMILQRAIRQAGFRGLAIGEATCGMDAVEQLGEKPVRLVITDWNMPGMLGIELLGALRAQGNQVPVGFVTSESSDAIRNQAMDAGAKFLITKPFVADDFETALAPIFGL